MIPQITSESSLSASNRRAFSGRPASGLGSAVIHNVLVGRAVDRADELERVMCEPGAWTLTYGDPDFI